jgi:hypothetical protein
MVDVFGFVVWIWWFSPGWQSYQWLFICSALFFWNEFFHITFECYENGEVCGLSGVSGADDLLKMKKWKLSSFSSFYFWNKSDKLFRMCKVWNSSPFLQLAFTDKFLYSFLMFMKSTEIVCVETSGNCWKTSVARCSA